ncbi:MAG: aspartate/glutamate racemase family protein [Proteobacteria bacterium]|nr:aspartate/glutamate racemase family protein [Pseudomonadota bacterium]
MRMIGLIGGMSWESTAVYYRLLNEAVRDRMGGLTSAEILLRSVDFSRIVALQQTGQWDKAAAVLAGIAQDLERAGADCILICTNTMHKLADAVQGAISIPLIHIVDSTGAALSAAGAHRPLLLATAYTMEQDFYRSRLMAHSGIEAMVPETADRAEVHRIIFEEICQGVVLPASRARYVAIMEKAKAAGADSVILGCTEIGLLVGQDDCPLPAFDSTLIHADAAVAFALSAQSGTSQAA